MLRKNGASSVEPLLIVLFLMVIAYLVWRLF
jgi:hypothetical protein